MKSFLVVKTFKCIFGISYYHKLNSLYVLLQVCVIKESCANFILFINLKYNKPVSDL